MRLKPAVIFVLLLFFFSCHSGKQSASSAKLNKQNTQEIINPNLPTVTLEKVKPVKLHSVLRYGTYIKPKASYPVLQVADAVIRSIPVTVGTFVKEGDLLYSFQQVLPGTSFGTGWVRAKNTGYISLIQGVEGHTVKKDEIVLVISDFNSAQLNFYLSNQDVGRVKNGQEVYFAEYIDELDKIDQKLNLHLSEDTHESLLRQKEKIQKLLEETKGKIIRMPIAPEEGLGVFNVQVDFPIHESLKIGRFVIIEMHVDPYEGLAVNQRNIQRRYGKHQVTVVHNNIVNYQEVEIGRTYGDMVVIKGGLKEGDEIVVATNRYIRPGVKVNIRRRGFKKPKEQPAAESKAKPAEKQRDPQKKSEQNESQKQVKTQEAIAAPTKSNSSGEQILPAQEEKAKLQSSQLIQMSADSDVKDDSQSKSDSPKISVPKEERKSSDSEPKTKPKAEEKPKTEEKRKQEKKEKLKTQEKKTDNVKEER